MNRLDVNRLNVTWAVLIALAIATVLVPCLVPRALFANAVLLALAAVKGRRIVLDYLDLRAAPALWRGLMSAWIVILVLFAWLASAAVALV
ncbi:cytochrome C oxidase subunit IV family protein [Bradyrhizobium sp. CCGUVB23]|uniref:cytochrome C oxidase subunit IV family protein n=1 Tax=Bradyrhizobium sp. CCGUVB23 TaxID=2949630 RepID=UPI0020B40B2B|nr:cytochrome C oxidase subunit IV family protein [Bradyrhizobium sp. CCGUVB23]MCP3467794.1 cytochrome C oxidase subunit IV family protein [Bradyrhizobium sp. CCGUVB23]